MCNCCSDSLVELLCSSTPENRELLLLAISAALLLGAWHKMKRVRNAHLKKPGQPVRGRIRSQNTNTLNDDALSNLEAGLNL